MSRVRQFSKSVIRWALRGGVSMLVGSAGKHMSKSMEVPRLVGSEER